MADKDDKFADNVSGEVHVDEQCIACGSSVNEAEDNFEMKDEQTYAYVYKQAENDTEKDNCLDAMEACPVDAIGDDGE